MNPEPNNRITSDKDWIKQLTSGGVAKTKDPSTETTSTVAATPALDEPSRKIGCGFKDVAGMADLKELVDQALINVLKNPEYAKAFGVRPPNILLYGPSGCGKTFFAEKLAEEVGVGFIKVVPDELASHYIHGTQEKIGKLFREAEKEAPVILFFDEFDAMVPQRSNGEDNNQNGETNEFLCMLNNSADRGIYVIAATNHPERIDSAILRSGRIDEIIYVGMPDVEARESLFRMSLSKIPSASDIDYKVLAELTNGYNCSDISYIVSVAARKMFNASIMETGKPYLQVTQALLEDTIRQKAPSVSGKMIREFERLRSQFSSNKEEVFAHSIGFH